MDSQPIRPAKGVTPDNYDPWRRLLAAFLVRAVRDSHTKKYGSDARSFLSSPWVTAWLRDEFGLCRE